MARAKKIPRDRKWVARRQLRKTERALAAKHRAAELLAVADATNHLKESDPVLREIERERKALYASSRRARETIEENDARLAELVDEAKKRREELRRT